MKNTKTTFDKPLLVITIILLLIGLSVLWSASTTEAEQNFGSTSYFIIRQLTRGVLVGLILMYIFSKFDYHRFKKPAGIFVVVALLLLILVKVPGLGLTANGATRWLVVGPLLFQPAELAKLAMILYISAWYSQPGRGMGHDFWKSIFPPVAIVGLMSFLIIWQPDLGSTISLLGIVGLMIYAGGTRLKYLFYLFAGGVTAVVGFAIIEPYRLQRITAFLNPSGDPLGISYQINQALIAVGTGGLLGYGYGLSRQKHFYLPEAINDSIFAVMAEELGFIRVVLILLLFAYLVFRGIKISLNTTDQFGKMLAFGLTSLIGVNVIINVGAIIGLIPLTGIPLPFFSYGSTAMIVSLSAVGILLNISKQNRAV